MPSPSSDFDRVVFDSGPIRIGAFRCPHGHPSFHDTGPARNFCFVFPRTAVEIQHEHEPAFVANPNVVTFYNQGQAYVRNPISSDGDRCDWFGLDPDIVLDVVRTIDPAVEARPEMPFRWTHGRSDSCTYLLQRRLFKHVASGIGENDGLGVEQTVVTLLEGVVRSTYRRMPPASAITPRHREIACYVEQILSRRQDQRLTLKDIAREAETSVYHLCRLFRRATGTTLHQYRKTLQVRWSLESVVDTDRPLTDIALEAGFSSHSHFTSAFHREFANTPSGLRARRATF